MRLPGRLPAEYSISFAKIRDYLLNPDHLDGGPKAAFFLGQGFSANRAHELADALADHAMLSPWHEAETMYGAKFTFEGPMNTPCGKTPTVRSVWMEYQLGGPANLVTAYPRPAQLVTKQSLLVEPTSEHET